MVEEELLRNDLTFNVLKVYYANKGLHLNDNTFKKNLYLLNKEGKYNYLAELLCDENRVSIKVARFEGIDKSHLLEKSEYGYKCLLVAIDRVINRLEAENYTYSVIKGARRVDKRLMDMSSIREIFINAICHNDYSIVEPAVYIFDNRIEFISHGGLPAGETKEMFFEGVSTPRNKELMKVLSDLEYVEQTGYGIPEVLKHYSKDIFRIEENYISVSVPFDKEVLASKANVPQNVPQKSEIDVIKDAIRNNPKITRKELAECINKSIKTVQRLLQNDKTIEYVGSSKTGHWEIIDKDK